ncbi:MAG: hypothetical protein M3Z24_13660 [Chloroflexota bacterium]|nr:hypothetical protein [Chloroflexota bacterium]
MTHQPFRRLQHLIFALLLLHAAFKTDKRRIELSAATMPYHSNSSIFRLKRCMTAAPILLDSATIFPGAV